VSGNRDGESRDKWRPRHRIESNSGAPSPYRAAPGFGLDKGKADGSGSHMGFTVGRGRSSGAPIMKPPLGSTGAILQVNKNESIPGKPCLLGGAFRYPRAKLLDIYRFQKLDSSFIKPETMEDVCSLTLAEHVEPLAFVAPDPEEEVRFMIQT